MDKTISVVMPVHNEEATLFEAIECILQQTYTDFELIIIDDCSTDGSLSIIQHYAEKDRRIVVVHNEINLGLATSLNIGIAKTRFDWIARMDADDISLPQRFEKQIEYLQNHPKVDILSTGLIDLTPQGEPFGKRLLPEHHNLLAWRTVWNSPAFHATTMMRKSKFLESGGYDSSQVLEDIELWSRMIQIGRFACLQEYLYHYRRTREEYQGILEKRTAATRIVCHTYINQILGRQISAEEFSNTRRSERIDIHHPLSRADVIHTNQLLLDLYTAMLQKGILDDTQLDEVQIDLYRGITNISLQCEEQTRLFGSLPAEFVDYAPLVKSYWKRNKLPAFVKWLLFALLNPVVFIKAVQMKFRKS
jgi:hypothetical protein